MTTNQSDEHVEKTFKAAAEAAVLSVQEKEAIKLALRTMVELEAAPPEGDPVQPNSSPNTGPVLVVAILFFLGFGFPWF